METRFSLEEADAESASRYIDETGILLPEGAGWGQILSYTTAEAARTEAIACGLPEDSNWAEILAHKTAEAAKVRARELGLPEDATWADINKYANQYSAS